MLFPVLRSVKLTFFKIIGSTSYAGLNSRAGVKSKERHTDTDTHIRANKTFRDRVV